METTTHYEKRNMSGMRLTAAMAALNLGMYNEDGTLIKPTHMGFIVDPAIGVTLNTTDLLQHMLLNIKSIDIKCCELTFEGKQFRTLRIATTIDIAKKIKEYIVSYMALYVAAPRTVTADGIIRDEVTQARNFWLLEPIK